MSKVAVLLEQSLSDLEHLEAQRLGPSHRARIEHLSRSALWYISLSFSLSVQVARAHQKSPQRRLPSLP